MSIDLRDFYCGHDYIKSYNDDKFMSIYNFLRTKSVEELMRIIDEIVDLEFEFVHYHDSCRLIHIMLDVPCPADAIKYLINKNVNIEAECDRSKDRPIHLVCQNYDSDFIKYFIQLGVQLNCVGGGSQQHTPLDCLIRNPKASLDDIRYLYHQGAHLSECNDSFIEFIKRYAPDQTKQQEILGFLLDNKLVRSSQGTG